LNIVFVFSNKNAWPRDECDGCNDLRVRVDLRSGKEAPNSRNTKPFYSLSKKK